MHFTTDLSSTALQTRPLIGLDRKSIEAEFRDAVAELSLEPGNIDVLYYSPQPGPDYKLFVRYFSGIAHEIAIELRNGVPFPEEFIQYWLDRHTASAHSWRKDSDPPVGVRFWVRKDDGLGFVSAEYKTEGTDYRMRFRTELIYDIHEQKFTMPGHN